VKGRIDTKTLLRSAQLCGLGGLGLVALTFFSFRLHLGLAPVSLCFLVLVVLQSLAGDFVASAAISVLAVVLLDYFFVEPVFSFRIASPLNALALISFLLTALVITRLVSKLRDRTVSSQIQHQNLERLYQLAQQLLELEPEVAAGTEFLEPFRGVFGVTAVCLYDAVTPELHEAGPSHHWLSEETRHAYMRGQDKDDRERKVSIRCIRVAGKTTGAIGFEGIDHPELTVGPLTALAAALLERMHAFRNASRASAAFQVEAYRSVILDALAHEFKTPLSTILAAAGALREAGSLGPEHLEMAEMVESEAARLGRLTTRLIRTARLEREEVKPWMELIDIAPILADTVEQYSRLSSDRQISVVKRCDSSEVLADPDLLRLAVSQLLDNACKYSPPGSPVDLIITRQKGQVAVRVQSRGASITTTEKSHIFERFYRGAEARRMAPGTGLGLYVARKIALAHGGNLDLDNEDSMSEGATFCLTIPIQNERDDVAAAS
jgi:two-component system, OmpR family, sensor histidine kinase KdpD